MGKGWVKGMGLEYFHDPGNICCVYLGVNDVLRIPVQVLRVRRDVGLMDD